MNLFAKLIKASFITSAVFTMVFSSVAIGAEAEKQKKELDQLILKSGLNKPQTYKEFWELNKGDYHGQVYKSIKSLVTQNQQAQMPVFKVVQAKNSLGETVNNIEMSLNGKVITFQYIGEQDKYLKFKNIYLTESDLININQGLTKMIKADPDFAREFTGQFKSSPEDLQSLMQNKERNEYQGMPKVSKETWSKMSQVDRANYLINLRSYWTDSLNVLRQIEKNEQRLRGVKAKTSKFEYLIQFFQNEATADISPDPVNPPLKFKKIDNPVPWSRDKQKPAGTSGLITLDSQNYLKLPFVDTGITANSGLKTSSKEAGENNCVIHGVISEYDRKGSCTKNIETLKKFYSTDSDGRIFEAIQKCESEKPTKMACNPYLYGYKQPGQPHCVDYDRNVNSPYQKATHADGPCEKESPLGNSLAKDKLNGTDFLKKDIKGPGRYATENLKMSSDELAQLYKDQQLANDKYVTDYLKSFLGEDVDKIKKGVALDNALIEKLANIQSVFDSQIKFARESCIKSNENPKYKQYDKNFWGACDQLQRRHLFIAQWLEQKIGCADGGKIDSKTLKCFCPPTGAFKVNPGEKCTTTNPVPPTERPISPTTQVDCEAADQFPGSGAVANSDGVCKCPADGKTPHRLTNTYRGQKYSCESGQFNWKPVLWIGGIIGGALLLSQLWPKKKKVHPPLDTCKLTPNCVPQCKENEYLNPDANNGKGACWPKTEGGTGQNSTDANSGGVPTGSTTN